jgi:hypothetical protein
LRQHETPYQQTTLWLPRIPSRRWLFVKSEL